MQCSFLVSDLCNRFFSWLTLDDKAMISCKRCYRSWHITESRFKCNNDRHDFVVSTTRGLATAISTSSHFVSGGGISWLQSVLNSL